MKTNRQCLFFETDLASFCQDLHTDPVSRHSDSDAGLDTCLPSIEQIEAELGQIGEEES